MVVQELRDIDRVFRFFSLGNEYWPFHWGTQSIVFRGQGNASWKLIPSAFRGQSEITDIYSQIDKEFETISAFARDLVSQGLYHPPSSWPTYLDFREFVSYKNKLQTSERVWPEEDFYEIIAIAQHFGLGTRFLDFTFDPRIALYFAAKSSLELKMEEDMAVFMTHITHRYLKAKPSEEKGPFSYRQRYQLIDPPTVFNENLKAQKGIFVGYFDENFRPDQPFSPIPLEDYLVQSMAKIVIPRALNAEILYRLSKQFVDARTLFPGISGIVKYMKEESPIFNDESFSKKHNGVIELDRLPDVDLERF